MKNIFTRPGFSAKTASLVTAIALAVILEGCYLQAKENDEKTASPPPTSNATQVDAIIVKPEVLGEELEVTGTLVANQNVEIVSELTRKVVAVNTKEGSSVRSGQVLFQLDDADLQAQLQRLRQQEKLASLNEGRLKDLIEKDAIVQQDYDEAFTSLKVLQAQIEELQITIDKTRITAPFDGHIGLINTHRGAVVSVNTVLTDISDNSVVKLEFSVPEKYIHKIKEGSKHTFQIAGSEQTFEATVYAKSPELNKETRNLKMRALARNTSRTLVPGQSAHVTLTIDQAAEALLIPSSALIATPEGYSVLKAKAGQAALTPVKIGARKVKNVEVTEGLHAGDTLIVSNLLRIGSGSPINIVTLH